MADIPHLRKAIDMSHATLTFSWLPHEQAMVTSDGHTMGIRENDAREHHLNQIVIGTQQANLDNRERIRQAREAFRSLATVQENVERSRPAGQSTRRYMIDLVTIGEQVLEIAPGEGIAYIREETRRRYPEPPDVVPPDFDTWWADNKADSNGWECAFVTAAVSSSIALGGAISVDPEYPLQTAMAELDRLEREGWRVLQVSEDRGLSTGLDGAEEARVIRMRYLLIAG